MILELHVQPGAARTEFAGEYGGRLKLRLAAPPVDGKANAALVAFLAEYYGVPKRILIEEAQWTATKNKA